MNRYSRSSELTTVLSSPAPRSLPFLAEVPTLVAASTDDWSRASTVTSAAAIWRPLAALDSSIAALVRLFTLLAASTAVALIAEAPNMASDSEVASLPTVALMAAVLSATTRTAPPARTSESWIEACARAASSAPSGRPMSASSALNSRLVGV